MTLSRIWRGRACREVMWIRWSAENEMTGSFDLSSFYYLALCLRPWWFASYFFYKKNWAGRGWVRISWEEVFWSRFPLMRESIFMGAWIRTKAGSTIVLFWTFCYGCAFHNRDSDGLCGYLDCLFVAVASATWFDLCFIWSKGCKALKELFRGIVLFEQDKNLPKLP